MISDHHRSKRVHAHHCASQSRVDESAAKAFGGRCRPAFANQIHHVRRPRVQHARAPIQPPSFCGLSAYSEFSFWDVKTIAILMTRSKNALVVVAALDWARPLDADTRARRRGRAMESPRRALRAVRLPSRSSFPRRDSPTRACRTVAP
jgi:hypothetical protein